MKINMDKPTTYLVGVTLHGHGVQIFTDKFGGIWITITNETEPNLFEKTHGIQSANAKAASMAKDFEAWMNRHAGEGHERTLRNLFGFKGVVWLKGNEVGQGDFEGWEIVE